MKPRRTSAPRKCPVAPDGTKLCKCGCGNPVGAGRRSWAGKECVEKWMIANSSEFVRIKLMTRDDGVCALCGRNAVNAERRLKPYLNYGWKWQHLANPYERWRSGRNWNRVCPKWFIEKWRSPAAWDRIRKAIEKRRLAMEAAGWPVHLRTSWWEADHIVPVAEGGGQPTTLDAYRTLCWTCHRIETNKLRARLRQAKKLATRKTEQQHHDAPPGALM